MKFKEKFHVFLAALFPSLAIAHSAAAVRAPDLAHVQNFHDLASEALNILNIAMGGIYSLFLLGLFYLGFRYMNALRTGDKSSEEYKKIFIGAVVGMAVLSCLWGLLNLLANTFGLQGVGIPQFKV